MDIKIEKIKDINFEHLIKWVSLQEEAFDITNITSYLKAIKNPADFPHIYPMAIIQDNNFIGIANIRYNKDSNFLYLEYFAISPDYRNNNLGQKAFKQIIEFARKIKVNGIIWEVLTPDQLKNEEAKILSIRRIHFYERLGGEIIKDITTEYILNESLEIRTYNIMAISFINTDSEELKHIVNSIFYGPI